MYGSLIRRRSGGGGGAPTPVNPYVTDGLVFHLDGADYNGTTWVDRVGGITLTKQRNTVNYDNNGGVYFNGGYLSSNSKVSVAYNAGTIEVVFKSDQTGWGILYFTDNSSDLMYGVTNGRVSYRPGNSRQTKLTGTITSIYSQSVSNSHNYFNGVSMGTSTNASWQYAAGYPTVIGAYYNTNHTLTYAINGTLYQLRIYNRILTATEIMQNFNADVLKYNIAI